MSLINDALKRAKEVDTKGTALKENPTTLSGTVPATATAPGMRPVENAPKPSYLAVYVLAAALAVVLLSAVLMVWMWSKSRENSVVATGLTTPASSATAPTTAAVAPPPAVVEPAVVPVFAAPQPLAPAPIAAVPVPVEASLPVTSPPAPEVKVEGVPSPTTSGTNTVGESVTAPATNAVVAAAAPATPPPPQFPTLKLQGIFYNSTKPSTVINGKTYFIGSTVAGARILQIEAEKVTVEWNGETRVLETAQ